MSSHDDPRASAAPEIREVSDEQKTRGIEVVFHVAVPADVMVETLWDVDNFPALFPDIKEHAVERVGPGDPPTEIDVRYRVDAVVKEVRYVLRRTLAEDGRSFTWREVSGDLRRVRGGWYVEQSDVPGLCRVTYRAFVDIGRFVPTRLVAKGARRKAGEMVTRVRQVATSLAAAG